MAGHLGVRRTKDRILTSFYWPGLDTSVKNYCLSCNTCRRCVGKHAVNKAPLQQVPIITTPFKKIAVDLVGPVNPASRQGNRYEAVAAVMAKLREAGLTAKPSKCYLGYQ